MLPTAPAATRLPRRRIRLAAALLATGTLLAACGSNTDTQNAAPAGDNPAVPCAAGDLTGERTVTGTFLGDVEVPAAPQRIISGWLVGTQLIDMGVRPVGMLDDYKRNATPQELTVVEGVPDIGSVTSGVNKEQVLALDPDLMITFVRQDMAKTLAVDEVNEVAAPTVAFEIQEPTDVWKNYQNVADAIGCGQFAKDRLAGLDDQLKSIATDNKDAIAKLGTVAFVEGSDEPGQYQIATNKSLMYQRLTLAGLKYFSGVDANPKRYNQQISLEDINRLSSANILFYEADYEGNATARTQALLDNPAFAQLPAVKAGNLFPLRTPYAYTTAAVERQAENIAAAVKAAKPVS
ncbi:putative ABC transporter substrate-binding protein [Gordonia hirsuta DSM 44140 = NBRC 16056]|uniref:Putative ABC transporter substrate-binding protein n=1 Tax=Gordonia hirsuta DSM 44140 = NBRC 16056 TaxID=1121927 RepID=L7LCK2_9ACTN|nr:ABC transporter substrate-binding protein [Gordonia hirsuta]GAC58634.1 putative ABC transporter substrate-binding protein [Gordonia hirsuta DSM 44140 = NBRC 16056]